MRVKTEAKRSAILNAALEVFLQSGFEGASMAEIATRVGGSKATLYGYFKSKAELFVAVINEEASRQVEPIFAALDQSADNLPTVLQRFGERVTEFLCTQTSVQMRRIILAEAGRSDIGMRFFQTALQRGIHELAVFLEKQMNLGRLKKSDSVLAATHLVALLECETLTPCLYGAMNSPSKKQITTLVRRALNVFLGAYSTDVIDHTAVVDPEVAVLEDVDQ
jgi:AcrR family transcriptional regulator